MLIPELLKHITASDQVNQSALAALPYSSHLAVLSAERFTRQVLESADFTDSSHQPKGWQQNHSTGIETYIQYIDHPGY